MDARDSIIQGVTDYFINCPLLKDGVFHVDSLGTDPVEYTIETETYDPILQTYINGASIRQFQFSFGSREYYSMDRIQMIENSSFYERLADWVEEQSRQRIFPQMPEGMQPEEMVVLSPGYIFDNSMKNVRYQIPLRLVYYKEASING